MNLLGILTSWTDGQLFGNSEQFARAEVELSGISGWFALASGHGPGPSGVARGHATGHLADATDELSRRPSQLSRRPGGLAGLTDESAGRPGHPAEPPGELAGRPGCLSRRPGPSAEPPDQSDGRPGEPEGGGDGARSPGAAHREGMDGPRERGFCARGGAVFAPTGRRRVATGGATGRRPERNPWRGTESWISAPAGRRSFAGRASAPVDAPFLCPSGAEENMNDALHGLRSLEDSLTPPVATGRDPSGVGEDGHARAIGARARAGGVHAFAGEVPEGRPPHTPLGHQRTGGSEVLRGF
jgi:hypothetical protein